MQQKSRIVRKNLIIEQQHSIKQCKSELELHKQQQPIYKKARLKNVQSLNPSLNPLKIQLDALSQLNIETSFCSYNPLTDCKNDKQYKDGRFRFHKQQNSRSQSKLKRNLSFTPKNRDVKKKRKFTNLEMANSLKNILQSLKQIIDDIRQVFIDIADNLQYIARQNKAIFLKNIKMIKQHFISLEKKSVKQNNLIKQLPSLEIDQLRKPQIPLLNLQKIRNQPQMKQDVTKEKTKSLQPKFSERTIKTERYTSKKFTFQPSNKAQSNFSTFRQALTKIKRLSFQGTILKL